MAEIVVDWLIRQETVEENSRELYEYAVQCLVLGMMPVVYAVEVGGIVGEMLTSIILILPFTIIRKLNGGFHAKNKWICLVSSFCLLYGCIIMVLYMKLKYSIWFNITIMMAIAILIFFSPIDSDNRRLDNNEKKSIKRKRRLFQYYLLGYI